MRETIKKAGWQAGLIKHHFGFHSTTRFAALLVGLSLTSPHGAVLLCVAAANLLEAAP